MIVTLRQLDHLLGSQEFTPSQLRNVPGLADVADRYAAALRYRGQLHDWAKQEAQRRRTQLRNRVRSVRADAQWLGDQIAATYRDLGVAINEPTSDALAAAWPQILAAVSARKTEADLLGEPGPDERYLSRVRAVRDRVQQLAAVEADIAHLERAIHVMDEYAADEDTARIEQQLAAEGLTARMPGSENDPAVRPRPDDQAAAFIQAHTDAATRGDTTSGQVTVPGANHGR